MTVGYSDSTAVSKGRRASLKPTNAVPKMESDNKRNNCDKDVPATLEVATPPGQQPESNNATHMGFQQTVMYGEYSKALGELAKKEAREDIGMKDSLGYSSQHYNFLQFI